MRYNKEELDEAAIADQLADAEQAERQANDPAYAHIKNQLLSYAAQCRANVKLYSSGGMHNAVIKGDL